jgi:predicted lipoprotein with Yx(FWY)xxD motif
MLAGCSSDEPPTTSETTEVPAAPQPSSTDTSPTTAVPVPVVAVRDSSLGDVLVDAAGMTLYVYAFDTPGVSTCVDACALTWPPLLATTIDVGDGLQPAAFTLVARPDGTTQVAVNGAPLYRFSGDIDPGDTAGQGFNELWLVVAPDGQPIPLERDD